MKSATRGLLRRLLLVALLLLHACAASDTSGSSMQNEVDPSVQRVFVSPAQAYMDHGMVVGHSFSDDGALVAFATRDGQVGVFRANDRTQVQMFRAVNTASPLRTVALSATGRFLAVAGDDYTLELFENKAPQSSEGSWLHLQSLSWTATTARPAKNELYGGILERVFDVKFASGFGGSVFAVASGGWERGVLTLYALDENKGEFVQHSIMAQRFQKWCVSLSFSPQGHFLLAASSDQSISVMRLTSTAPEGAGAGEHDQSKMATLERLEVDKMAKEENTLVEWYERDDRNRWVPAPMIFRSSGSDGVAVNADAEASLRDRVHMVEFERLTNNIQNWNAGHKNNFVTQVAWDAHSWKEGPRGAHAEGDDANKDSSNAFTPCFAVTSFEANLRYYCWNATAMRFHARLHTNDGDADESPLVAVAMAPGGTQLATLSFGLTVNVYERANPGAQQAWKHVQRIKHATGKYSVHQGTGIAFTRSADLVFTSLAGVHQLFNAPRDKARDLQALQPVRYLEVRSEVLERHCRVE